MGENLALKTTPKVLKRGQPALQMESDYELARQAIPGALKTVESFWINSPDNPQLLSILTEGYCQYGTAFVEDDWEAARLKKDLEATEYHNDRSTKMFTRCLNYALTMLGDRWKKEIFANSDVVAKLVKDTGKGKRFQLMFAGLALGSLINHNQTRVDGTINSDMLGYLDTVTQILRRVIEIDGPTPKTCPAVPAPCPGTTTHLVMPYVAFGMLDTARSKALGGDPEKGKAMFQKAIDLTGGRFLLARALMGIRYGIAANDRKFFHEQLRIVLETSPSVWPEQRLANEVAHRKARRYLKLEKELFQ
ncbi:MAG TPA: TRAP transporter TatT component family protein [Kofleriaceae bacterium]|nr:TRAP transporter TatT component family protein [Kofleriaceae bacterium]